MELRRVVATELELIAAVQAIVDQDPTFFTLTDGAPAGPTMVRDELSEVPTGVTLAQKWVYAVLVEGEVVAMLEGLAGYPVATTWYLGLIYVAPSARDRGLGRTLIARIGQIARDGGATTLRLAVHEHNTDARRFYDRLGFAFVERRPRRDHQCDVLERALTAP